MYSHWTSFHDADFALQRTKRGHLNLQRARKGRAHVVFGRAHPPFSLDYFVTVNCAAVVLVSEPETPVKVILYVPGVVLTGKRMPERARAVWSAFTLTVCGKSPHTELGGPPEQRMVTLPAKPSTESISRRNAPRTPRRTVSDEGFAVSVKLPVVDVTAKLTVTGAAAL